MRVKYQPQTYERWHDFLSEQRAISCELLDIFAEQTIFPNPLLEDGTDKAPITTLKDLDIHISVFLEVPIRTVLNKLSSVDKLGSICRIDGVINFIHLDDREMNENPGKLLGIETPSSQEDEFQPDGICICSRSGASEGPNILLYPFDVKWPHTLTAQDLRAALGPTTGFVEVSQPTPNGIMSNPVKEALTGAYNNMVKSLAEFGMVTIGSAFVFLRVDWADNARTLYYHLAEPEHDMSQVANEKDGMMFSAAFQCIAFTIMALKKCHHSELERRMEIREALQRA
ncbi:hypothetical protein E4U13_004531 [Claviceps humidiphila]|uniref:Uncharacterized protein n=1 Tax=Claviceps humidiphila TaxID=1294629 RepID=A0A9P7TP24_9HYPO|nr:hypothetical protein E4U13_004531 [Claviceps humidiphila]